MCGMNMESVNTSNSVLWFSWAGSNIMPVIYASMIFMQSCEFMQVKVKSHKYNSHNVAR